LCDELGLSKVRADDLYAAMDYLRLFRVLNGLRGFWR
jgi:hypothetical protein